MKNVIRKSILWGGFLFVLTLCIAVPFSSAAGEPAWLGVEVKSLSATPSAPDNGRGAGRRERIAQAVSAGGLLVTDVAPGSPAAKMGLRNGDRITGAEGQGHLTSPVELANIVAEMKPGEEIALTVFRGGVKSIFLGKLVPLPKEGRKIPARVPATVVSGDTEIVVQMGHTAGVSRVAFSPDGAFILSSEYGKFIKLWDVATGREVRDYKEFEDNVSIIAFSPDGKYFLSGGGNGELKVWDFASGRTLWSKKGHAEGISAAVFSPDGRYLLSGSSDKTLTIRERATGREIRTFSGIGAAVTAVAFSPDAKSVLSASKEGILQLWDVGTGNEVNAFRGKPGWIRAVAFSPEGRFVFSGNEKTLIKAWEVVTGMEMKSFSIAPEDVSDVTFSPDGKTVLTVGTDRVFHLWDIFAGREIRQFSGHSILVYDVSFSQDGRYIVSGSEDRTLKIWEAATGRLQKTLAGNGSWIYSAHFSPDGGQAVSASGDLTVKQWDLSRGAELAAFNIHKSKVKAAVFSKDGKHVLSASDGLRDVLQFTDISTGKIQATLKQHGAWISAAALSPDGKTAVFATQEKVKLWDTASGKELNTFGGHTAEVNAVAFSPDGRSVLSGSGKIWGKEDNTLRLWNLADGREIRKFTGHAERVVAVAFSPDGHLAASGSSDKTIKLWKLATGEEIRTFAGHQKGVSAVAFSHDGSHLLSGSNDNTIKLWDIATGKEIRTFLGHGFVVRSVSFSPDDLQILSGSFDGTTRLWSTTTGQELARFIGFNDREWIVITPEGYYSASQNGHKHLSIRMGNAVFGIDQFYDVFYRPDIVAAKLKGEDIGGLITLTIDEALKNPPPVVEFASSPADTDAPRAKVCYRIDSTGGGIGEVRVFHNGKLIQSDGFYREMAKAAPGKGSLAALDGKSIHAELRGVTIKGEAAQSPTGSHSKGETYEDCRDIEAVPGENEISVTAFNRNNTVQAYMKTASFQSRLAPGPPHLYILSIGIDQYRDAGINLKYAVKDAGDMVEKVQKQSSTLYRSENIHQVMLTNREATKGQIQARIDAFSRIIKPSDGFILFVAGHGVLLRNQYYMLTHDFDGQMNEETMISSNEIVEMSKKVRSLNQLLIFDTCHAGGVDYIVSGLYDARISVLAKKMGLHIYASASDKQAALDGYEGNGLFTHTLLEGLNNNRQADQNKDGRITVMDLGGYAKKATADISKAIGHSQTPLIINFGKDYPLYKLQ